MAKKVLAIVQADQGAAAVGPPSALVAHARALSRAGADVHLLLCGGAVAYGLRRLGAGAGVGPGGPSDAGVAALVGQGKNVFYVEDDAQAQRIAATELIDGLTPVRSSDVPSLLHGYERVWHW